MAILMFPSLIGSSKTLITLFSEIKPAKVSIPHRKFKNEKSWAVSSVG